MHTTLKKVARGARVAMGVLLVAAGLTVAAAVPAHANWIVARAGFEGTPASDWTFSRSGVGSGGFEINAGTAMSGYNNGWLRSTTGWSGVGKTVNVSIADRFQVRCNAGIFVQSSGDVLVNFEVIDPATWTYEAVSTVNVTSPGYKGIGVGPWRPGTTHPFIRVSLLGDGTSEWVRLDELTVQCWVS